MSNERILLKYTQKSRLVSKDGSHEVRVHGDEGNVEKNVEVEDGGH